MGSFGKRCAAMSAVAVILALSACGGQTNVRKSLGLIGEGPDEFTVVKRKPLTMPENLEATALPTPQPGAPNLVDPRPLRDAQLALQGDAMEASEAPSAAETAFVAAAGADQADDAVREAMRQVDDSDELILNRMLGIGRDRGDTLDPAAEADRLAQEAQALRNPNLELRTQAAAQ